MFERCRFERIATVTERVSSPIDVIPQAAAVLSQPDERLQAQQCGARSAEGDLGFTDFPVVGRHRGQCPAPFGEVEQASR